MINRDENGFIVDITGDGGDTANRTGLYNLFIEEDFTSLLLESKGLIVRHPRQSPWNNYKNCTRDQMLPLVAGYYKHQWETIVRRIFWAHARRCFFSQDFEKDAAGTTKYPWPHTYEANEWHPEEFKYFDFAELLLPGDVWHLILCGRMWYFYWFAPVGYLSLALQIIVHAFSSGDEEAQIISQCVVAGPPFKWLYKTLRPSWREKLDTYWSGDRHMSEMAEAIKRGME